MNRWVSTIAGLCVACSSAGEPVSSELQATQPMIVVRSETPSVGLPAVDIAPTHLDPLVERNTGAQVEYAGLIDPSTVVRPDWVVSEPSDLMTSVRGIQPSLVFGPENRDYERIARDPSVLRVVTFPEGEAVECEVHIPEQMHGEITHRVTLIPRRPLENRWYAFEVTSDFAVGETVRGERAQLARFRPDSHPILTHLLMGSREGQSIVEVRFSERVAGDVSASEWTLSDERGQLQCSVLGPERGREEHHAVFNCERLPEGRARIDFGGTMQTVVGTELVDANERAMATVEFDAEPPVREGRDGDSARETVRRVPVFTM